MKTVVLSDVHLNPLDCARRSREEFARFLLRVADEHQPQRMILLGDLFDFWFEYRHCIFSGYFEVLRAFAELRDNGIELVLVCGNHDFWAGRFLHDTLGFSIHTQTYETTFGERKAWMVHGDGLNPKDIGYRVYKRLVRIRLIVWAFRQLHPDWAMAIAQKVSRTSRRLLDHKDPAKGAEAAALREFARDILASGKADLVFCGHSHSPVLEEMPGPSGMGMYINTGDWMHHRSYVVWDGEKFSLLYDPAPESLSV